MTKIYLGLALAGLLAQGKIHGAEIPAAIPAGLQNAEEPFSGDFMPDDKPAAVVPEAERAATHVRPSAMLTAGPQKAASLPAGETPIVLAELSPVPTSTAGQIAEQNQKRRRGRVAFQRRMTEIRSAYDTKLRQWESKAARVDEKAKLGFDKRLQAFRKHKLAFEKSMEKLDDKADAAWKASRDESQRAAARLKSAYEDMKDAL